MGKIKIRKNKKSEKGTRRTKTKTKGRRNSVEAVTRKSVICANGSTTPTSSRNGLNASPTRPSKPIINRYN